MAREIINLGTPPNGVDGDTIRAAMDKCNDNFQELYEGVESISQISGKNMLINCGIPVNQRNFAGGALAAGVYGYDRWKAGTGGCNVSINATTGVFTHTSGPLVQVIESPLVAWGSPITVSVENPSSTLSISLGGSTGTITAGSGRRGVTLTPSGSGNMTFQITAAGATYSRPQVERGDSFSSFDARMQGLELMLCQRYYEVVDGFDIISTAYNAVDITFWVPFKVQKRAAVAGSIPTNPSWVGNNANGTTITILISSPTNKGFRADVTVFTGSVVPGASYMLRGGSYVGDAEL